MGGAERERLRLKELAHGMWERASPNLKRENRPCIYLEGKYSRQKRGHAQRPRSRVAGWRSREETPPHSCPKAVWGQIAFFLGGCQSFS